MRKERDSKSSKNTESDGTMRFVVKLPKETAVLFMEEMRHQDRKKMPLARYIIQRYFRDRDMRKEFEEFIELRALHQRHSPHFGLSPVPQRHVAD